MSAVRIVFCLLFLPAVASAQVSGRPRPAAERGKATVEVAQPVRSGAAARHATRSDEPTLAPAPAASASAAAPPPPVAPVSAFNPGALLQAWLLLESGPPSAATFRIRRAELWLQGEIVPERFAYRISVDIAKVLEPSSSRVFVDDQLPPPASPDMRESVTVRQASGPLSIANDIYATYLSTYADLSLGQFKIPVSLEGIESSAKTLFAQRAAVSREFGDRRDIGLRASKSFGSFAYTVALLNGSGANTLDRDSAKDAALRVEFVPRSGLTLAAGVYATLWRRDRPGAKDRYELDVRYDDGPLRLQAEFIGGRDVGGAGAIHAHGFYVAGRYRLLDVFEPVLRIGHLDHDIERDVGASLGIGQDEQWSFECGVNYLAIPDLVRLTLDYALIVYDDLPAGHELIFAAQFSY